MTSSWDSDIVVLLVVVFVVAVVVVIEMDKLGWGKDGKGREGREGREGKGSRRGRVSWYRLCITIEYHIIVSFLRQSRTLGTVSTLISKIRYLGTNHLWPGGN